MSSIINHNTLPEFRNIVARFKETGTLGADRQPVQEPRDELNAHFAKESYQEFVLSARELDWVKGQPRSPESLDSDGRAGHYQVDVPEGSADVPEGAAEISGYARFHENGEAPAELFILSKVAEPTTQHLDEKQTARVMVAVDRRSEDGSLNILTGQLNGYSMSLQAFYFGPDGSVMQESIEQRARGLQTPSWTPPAL
jgi:hypothetical protein